MRDIKTLQIDISNIFSLPFYTELDQFCFKYYKVVIIRQTTSFDPQKISVYTIFIYFIKTLTLVDHRVLLKGHSF